MTFRISSVQQGSMQTHAGERLLLVEGSRPFSTVLKQNLVNVLGVKVEHCASLAAVQSCLMGASDGYALAVFDLDFDDSADFDVLDFVVSQGVAAIVLAGALDGNAAEQISRRNIVDCVFTGEPTAITAVTNLVDRTLTNAQTYILLADSCEATRSVVAKELIRHGFNVETQTCAAEALLFLDTSPTPDIIISHMSLSDMTGEAFLDNIQIRSGLESVAVFAYGETAGPLSAAHFLKRGATEFLPLPLEIEEFNIRLFRIAAIQTRIRALQRIASRDFLTNLYNRRFFYQQAPRLIDQGLRRSHPMSIAILDIDHFKQLNDTYGHETGDRVLAEVASRLQALVGHCHLLARLGGEEFGILFQGLDIDDASQVCNRVLAELSMLRILVDGEAVSITLSAGLAAIAESETFENYLHAADQFLYMAKFAGRNQLVSEVTMVHSLTSPGKSVRQRQQA